MEHEENSDETALQTSSSDIDDDTCHQAVSTEYDTNANLPQPSHRIDQRFETKGVLKQPLLSNDQGTLSAEITSNVGSDLEYASRIDDSENHKYAEINNQKRKYFQYVLRAYQYSKGNMPEWTEKINGMDSKWGQCLRFIDAFLRGVSQIGFVNSPIFGLGTFLVALFTDTWIGICGMIGCLCTSVFAVLFKLNKETFRLGLFGFNGYLFGASLAIYLSAAWDWRTIVLTIILAPLTIIFQLGIGNILSPYNCPPFGLPLCIVANLLFLALQNAQPNVQAAVANAVSNYEIPHDKWDAPVFFQSLGRCIALTFFKLNPWSAIGFAVLLLLYSPVHTLNAVTGSIINTATLFVLGVDEAKIANGVLGWNSTLLCLMLAEFFKHSLTSWLYAVFGSILTTLLHVSIAPLFAAIGLPEISLPYTIIGYLFVISRALVLPD